MIYLSSGRQEITPQGRKTEVLEFKPGDVKWSPASGMHVSEITSDQPVAMVEVELKKPGGPASKMNAALDPVKVDPKDYKVEFENSQVRVVRVKIGAHQKVPLHEHFLNRVVVYLTDQNGPMTTRSELGRPHQAPRREPPRRPVRSGGGRVQELKPCSGKTAICGVRKASDCLFNYPRTVIASGSQWHIRFSK
jgi:hypothetical protein